MLTGSLDPALVTGAFMAISAITAVAPGRVEDAMKSHVSVAIAESSV
tara:strand:+ start:842 stop:982 length:141 start_codon:yes stop_codon:yes gene_type:complete